MTVREFVKEQELNESKVFVFDPEDDEKMYEYKNCPEELKSSTLECCYQDGEVYGIEVIQW